MIGEFTDELVEAGLPVIGVLVEEGMEERNCKIQWTQKPTEEQRALAKQIRENFDWNNAICSEDNIKNKLSKMSNEDKNVIIELMIIDFAKKNRKLVKKLLNT